AVEPKTTTRLDALKHAPNDAALYFANRAQFMDTKPLTSEEKTFLNNNPGLYGLIDMPGFFSKDPNLISDPNLVRFAEFHFINSNLVVENYQSDLNAAKNFFERNPDKIKTLKNEHLTAYLRQLSIGQDADVENAVKIEGLTDAIKNNLVVDGTLVRNPVGTDNVGLDLTHFGPQDKIIFVPKPQGGGFKIERAGKTVNVYGVDNPNIKLAYDKAQGKFTVNGKAVTFGETDAGIGMRADEVTLRGKVSLDVNGADYSSETARLKYAAGQVVELGSNHKWKFGANSGSGPATLTLDRIFIKEASVVNKKLPNLNDGIISFSDGINTIRGDGKGERITIRYVQDTTGVDVNQVLEDGLSLVYLRSGAKGSDFKAKGDVVVEKVEPQKDGTFKNIYSYSGAQNTVASVNFLQGKYTLDVKNDARTTKVASFKTGNNPSVNIESNDGKMFAKIDQKDLTKFTNDVPFKVRNNYNDPKGNAIVELTPSGLSYQALDLPVAADAKKEFDKIQTIVNEVLTGTEKKLAADLKRSEEQESKLGVIATMGSYIAGAWYATLGTRPTPERDAAASILKTEILDAYNLEYLTVSQKLRIAGIMANSREANTAGTELNAAYTKLVKTLEPTVIPALRKTISDSTSPGINPVVKQLDSESKKEAEKSFNQDFMANKEISLKTATVQAAQKQRDQQAPTKAKVVTQQATAPPPADPAARTVTPEKAQSVTKVAKLEQNTPPVPVSVDTYKSLQEFENFQKKFTDASGTEIKQEDLAKQTSYTTTYVSGTDKRATAAYQKDTKTNKFVLTNVDIIIPPPPSPAQADLKAKADVAATNPKQAEDLSDDYEKFNDDVLYMQNRILSEIEVDQPPTVKDRLEFWSKDASQRTMADYQKYAYHAAVRRVENVERGDFPALIDALKNLGITTSEGASSAVTSLNTIKNEHPEYTAQADAALEYILLRAKGSYPDINWDAELQRLNTILSS
ncbi:hypothetical protein KY328_02960, partial [Candidatus Woesearchaeota archaeon]|nr:hypothetical protein [Candidatus Woesearchaeota archaeon]